MGGEWEFNWVTSPIQDKPLEIAKYQELLQHFRVQYADEFPAGSFLPPDDVKRDNVFARFKYTCSRHDWHGEADWTLWWDPTKEDHNLNNRSRLHGRCAPENFMLKCMAMQRQLIKAFPDRFDLYYGDGDEFNWDESGASRYRNAFTPHTGMYLTGDGSSVFAFQGEEPDYTACSADDCGNCGRCSY